VGREFGVDPGRLASDVMDKMAEKVSAVVSRLLADYGLDPSLVSLVGGGGGCSTVVPWLSRKMNMKYIVSENPEVVSAIGAAMAMLRDSVARNIVNPGAADIAAVRSAVIKSLVEMGADPNTVEVQIEIDGKKNIVQATASGALEMQSRDFGKEAVSEEGLLSSAAAALNPAGRLRREASTGPLTVFSADRESRYFLGLMKKKRKSSVVLDKYGVVKLRASDAETLLTSVGNAAADCDRFIETCSGYNDAGQIVPSVFLLHGSKISDLSTIMGKQQLLDIISLELDGDEQDAPVVLLASPR